MNVYIETKPVRVINDGKELVWWSERDGWAQYLPVRRRRWKS